MVFASAAVSAAFAPSAAAALLSAPGPAAAALAPPPPPRDARRLLRPIRRPSAVGRGGRRAPGRRHAGAAAAPKGGPLLLSPSRQGDDDDAAGVEGGGGDAGPAAAIVGPPPSSPEEASDLAAALRIAGYRTVTVGDDRTVVAAPGDSPPPGGGAAAHRYVHSRATGMLKLVDDGADAREPGGGGGFEPPRWVPVVRGEENVLVANGWSFLDPDESEPISAFDIDAANSEGLYRPKWGEAEGGGNGGDDNGDQWRLSSLGFDLRPMSSEDVLAEADGMPLPPPTDDFDPRSVLLSGATDPPGIKRTANGFDFTGPAGQSDVPRGVFACAVGGLPLFTSADLAPTTASSGWLSFARPVSDDHVALVPPEDGAADRRVEAVCARSGCHLGHYFGRGGEGYCINASALDFIPTPSERGAAGAGTDRRWAESAAVRPLKPSRPVSWRGLDGPDRGPSSPSLRILRETLLSVAPLETIVLGAGCFWHVEAALRRLPGVVDTAAGYAGGATPSPTYEAVCRGRTGHAEVVRVTYDPEVCPPRVLMDCFLSMHDPTKVRAHGKHAAGTGQYRSSVFAPTAELRSVVALVLEECRAQLGRELSTELRLMGSDVNGWFWRAEDRHQRHDERLKGRDGLDETAALSVGDWLRQYGRRSDSIWGAGETVRVATDDSGDDGMARMMI